MAFHRHHTHLVSSDGSSGGSCPPDPLPLAGPLPLSGEQAAAAREAEALLVRALQAELKAINADMSCCFNQQFGGIFRTDTHPSLFSVAVRKYADIYMKDVSSLIHYSPNHKFYPTQSLHMVGEERVSLCVHRCGGS